jgi:rhodanese-related sulfurtransferase
MKASLILAVAFALAGSFTSAWEKKATAAPEKAIHRNVNADEFEKLSKEPDTVILDVRSPKEYAAGHIKNSVLIDFNGKDFDEKIKQLDKGKTYLVHCAVGGRSAKACTKMDNYDFPKVVNFEGGIKAWEKAGKPVEK